MWESLNSAWLEFSAIKPATVTSNSLPELLDWVRSRSALYRGAMLNTNLAQRHVVFSPVGTFIERADSTARILTSSIIICCLRARWSAARKTIINGRRFCGPSRRIAAIAGCSRTTTGRLKIADFMILNRQMPRSLRSCYDELTSALRDLATSLWCPPHCHTTAEATRDLLLEADIQKIFQSGLHEFVQDFIARNNKLGSDISAAYHFSD